jgi:acetylornithine deacetylase
MHLLLLAILWLLCGVSVLVWHATTGDDHFRLRALGLNLSFGWLMLLLGLYFLARWWSVRSAAEGRKLESVRAARVPRVPHRRQPVSEPDPTFDFTAPAPRGNVAPPTPTPPTLTRGDAGMLETTRLLRDLVSRPSVNPMGRPLQGPQVYEHQVTDYLEGFFRSLGVRHQRQNVAPLRDNIVAWWEPPGASATLVFEAHQDTVPTDQMTVEPFGARIDGGRLYGRGACDVKGGMAAMLVAFARLVREKPAGCARVVMACTVDEEHTFLGVQRLAELDLGQNAPGLWGAVVAEPTGLQIVNAHKGVVRWMLHTAGRACHSSRPELGVNAIYHMAHLLPAVERYAADLQATRPHALLGPATLSVGRIEGGSSANTVPDRCRIEIDRRLLPGEDAVGAATTSWPRCVPRSRRASRSSVRPPT